MLKIIALILGLAIGFGGGVYWASHNPDAATKLSTEEERRFLEAQLAVTQKIKEKLDRLSSNTSPTSGTKTPGSGFVSTSGTSAAVSADVKDLKNQTQSQEQELKKRINALK
jgi:hypothetical protein